MNEAIQVTWTPKLTTALQPEMTRIRKAMETTLKVEAFRVRKVAKQGLRKGQLRLTRKSVYRGPTDKRRKTRRGKYAHVPLRSLSKGIAYDLNRSNLSVSVGFLGKTPGTAWARRIAEKSVRGYVWRLSTRYKQLLHHRGIHLREDTRSVMVGPRNIIGKLYQREQRRISQNIADNFQRKLRGERI